MNHIDLHDKYALLDNGLVEDLWWDFGDGKKEPREAYKDEDGCYYLDHDRYMDTIGDGVIECWRVHSKIIATANSVSEILKLRDEYVKSRKTEEENHGT